jgi:hypothetical protein
VVRHDTIVECGVVVAPLGVVVGHVGHGDGTVTEPRWDRGIGTDEERWAGGWYASTGPGYAVLRYQGSHPWRGGPRGYRRRRRGYAFDGLWLPVLLLLLFVNAHSAWVLLPAFLVVAVVIATAIASALGNSAPVQGNTADALPPRVPAAQGMIDPQRTPYRLSAGALAAVDGHDLYRKRLLDILKARYIKGQISLEDFEARATRIARDPSARHLG